MCPDCDSGALCEGLQQDPEMASVKLEDCSQTLGLIKDEEEIGKYIPHGERSLTPALTVKVLYYKT